jgi:hypothetical protein
LSTRLSVSAVALLVMAAGCSPSSKNSSSRKSTALCATAPDSSAKAGTATSSADKPDLKKAGKLYKEGERYYAKGRPGKPDSNKNLQAACKRFRAARKIYQQALKADPKSKKLEQVIQKCNVKIHSCLKMQTL